MAGPIILLGFARFQDMIMRLHNIVDYRYVKVSFSHGGIDYMGQIDLHTCQFTKLFSIPKVQLVMKDDRRIDVDALRKQWVNQNELNHVPNTKLAIHHARLMRCVQFFLDEGADPKSLIKDLSLTGNSCGYASCGGGDLPALQLAYPQLLPVKLRYF